MKSGLSIFRECIIKIPSIVLFGFKGAGKTHLGRLLSQYVSLPFIDTDDLLEQKYHKTARELYHFVGDTKFREIEKEIIKEISVGPTSVIALGGGAILHLDNQDLLKTSHLIYLKASFATVQKRIFKDGIPAYIDPINPLLSLQKIYLDRLPMYQSIPAKCVDVDLLDELSCVMEIKKSWPQTLLEPSFE